MDDHKEKFEVRDAHPRDALAIVAVHHAAVHSTCAADYEQAILDDWSSLDPERVSKLQTQIQQNPEGTVMLVAELNGSVVGFGEIAPLQNELRAVYVSPTISRRAVGTTILNSLEVKARELGVEKLWLDSSITAKPFYLSKGYIVDSEGTHELRSGRKMLCYKMHKLL